MERTRRSLHPALPLRRARPTRPRPGRAGSAPPGGAPRPGRRAPPPARPSPPPPPWPPTRARPPSPAPGAATARPARRAAAARRAPAARPRRSAARSTASCRSLPTRLSTTPTTRTAGSNERKPCSSAATLRDCPRQSTTSTTGAPSSPATCAVEPCPSARRPSKSPITPSTTATSAPAAPCRNSGAIRSLADQHRVEVAARPPGGERVVAGVDVVGADLERRHGRAPPAQRGHQPGRDRRLPAARRRRRDDEARARHRGPPALRTSRGTSSERRRTATRVHVALGGRPHSCRRIGCR